MTLYVVRGEANGASQHLVQQPPTGDSVHKTTVSFNLDLHGGRISEAEIDNDDDDEEFHERTSYCDANQQPKDAL